MAYASWSVVFGEQPSAAKWNILGTNDASFNDGTGIGSSVITESKMNFSSFDPVLVAQGGTAETTTSTSYVNTTTISAVTGTFSVTRVKITVGGLIYNSGAALSYLGFAISGATTLAAADARAASMFSTNGATISFTYVATITAGSNTFTPQKKAQANTTNIDKGYIIVEPIYNPSS